MARPRPPQLRSGPFFAGANLPWRDFGYDFGVDNFDAEFFSQTFAQLAAYGANAVRVWLHADGRGSPSFGAGGVVTGPGGHSFVADLHALTALARAHRLVLQLCLWSFDMCKLTSGTHADLIQDMNKTSSYIHHALLPILRAIGDDPNVIIEVINEPEWCLLGTCTTDQCVSVAHMQRFTAAIASAVHVSSPLLVTTGCASLKWMSKHARPESGEAFLWSDGALQSAYPAGGASSVLDLYNAHFYDWMVEWGYDPCNSSAAAWGLDKPCVIGELPATSAIYTAEGMLDCALEHGCARCCPAS